MNKKAEEILLVFALAFRLYRFGVFISFVRYFVW